MDSHNNADVRALLLPLAELAAKHRVAVVAVTHFNKGTGVKATYRAMGSLAFVAAARAVWMFHKDRNDRDRRLFLPDKNNLAPEGTGLAYKIIEGMVSWEADPVSVTADEAFADEADHERGGRSSGWKQCAEWLKGVLADGPILQKEAHDLARKQGFTPKQLRLAREHLKVVSSPEGKGTGSAFRWELPDNAACPSTIKDNQQHHRAETMKTSTDRRSTVLQPDDPLAAFDWDGLNAVNLCDRPAATWSADDQRLVDWFQAAVNYLPAEPFDLSRYEQVVDPPAFYQGLKGDVVAGPRGPRGRTGAVQRDLQKLRDRFRDAEPKHEPKRHRLSRVVAPSSMAAGSNGSATFPRVACRRFLPT